MPTGRDFRLQAVVQFHALFRRPSGLLGVDAKGVTAPGRQREAGLVALTYDPRGIAADAIFGGVGAGTEVGAAAEVGGRAPEDGFRIELERQYLRGRRLHRERIASAEDRQQFSRRPPEAVVRMTFFVHEAGRADEHVGR